MIALIIQDMRKLYRKTHTRHFDKPIDSCKGVQGHEKLVRTPPEAHIKTSLRSNNYLQQHQLSQLSCQKCLHCDKQSQRNICGQRASATKTAVQLWTAAKSKYEEPWAPQNKRSSIDNCWTSVVRTPGGARYEAVSPNMVSGHNVPTERSWNYIVHKFASELSMTGHPRWSCQLWLPVSSLS